MKLNNITKFFLIFAACYFSLYALHKVDFVRNIHNRVFITGEQFAFNLFHNKLKTDFDVYKRIEGVPYTPELYDYSIRIFDKKDRNPRSQGLSVLNASLDKTSIAPLLLFFSLLIATPRRWQTKIWIGLLGMFLIFILIALKYSFMFSENLDGYPPSGLWGLLTKSFGGAFRSQEYLLLNVIFIWVLSALRIQDVKWFLK